MIKSGFSTGVLPVVLQNGYFSLESLEENGRPTKWSEHTIRSVTDGGWSSVDYEMNTHDCPAKNIILAEQSNEI